MNAVIWTERRLNINNFLCQNEEVAEVIETQLFRADAHSNLGSLLYDRGDEVGAEWEFRAALILNQKNSNTNLNLGRLLWSKVLALEKAGENPDTIASICLESAPKRCCASFKGQESS